jgi:putative transposase
VVTPAQRRAVVTVAMTAAHLSERRAGRFMGFARSTQRYQPERAPDLALRARLRELAERRRRWGYRQLWRLLRREGLLVNRKRVQRLYQEEGLQVRRRRRKRRAVVPRHPLPIPTHRNERWSMDFVRDTLGDGRAFRALTIVDDCSRECPAIVVDVALPAERVIATLEHLAATRGLPRGIVCANGPEFASAALDDWAHYRGIRLDFIDPGKPTQNAFIESFNGTFREECLNEHWFLNLNDARQVIENWRLDYQRERPHSSLGGRTPEEFALTLTNATLGLIPNPGLPE